MKQLLVIVFLVAAFGRADAQTQPLVSFQFSRISTVSLDGPVPGWIDVQGDPAQSVITVSDPVSHITISTVATANWHSDVGAASVDLAGYTAGTTYFFPAHVMLSDFYQYSSGSQAEYNAQLPQFQLSGLNKDSFYTVSMSGSDINDPNHATTQYTVAGSAVYPSQTIDCYNNSALGVTFQNVFPDNHGVIRVYVSQSAPSQFAFICGLQVIPGGTNVVTGSNRWIYNNGTLYDSLDNIAIGTSNPQGYKLAVNGTGIFTKLKVKPVGSWPDYVFRKDFQLPALPALERYIHEHQHLPGIAAEAEVRAGGIDVGEHQAALLQKVEELTLYLIAENKRLTEQIRRLEDQQKQIDELKALMAEKNKQK